MSGSVTGAVVTNGMPVVSISWDGLGAVFVSIEVARDLAEKIVREADAAEEMALRLNVDSKDDP